jgi:tetratricopeptide (TPR) repeat protein
LKAAEAAYEATLSYDSKASDALIRLGAIRCQSNREASHLAFEQAESIARNAVTLWQERALCALKTGPVELAVQSAKRALSVAPDDPQNSYLLIVAHERAKQHDSARKLAWYVVSRFPRDSYGWELLGSLYSGQYRAAIVAEATVRTLNVDGANRLPTATRRPTILAPILPEDSKPSTLRIQAHTALIAALYSGNDQAVSRAARQLRLTSLKLSIRAFELGAYDVAYLEAARAARIAPDNSDARALTLLLSELLGKTEMLTELLQQAIPSGNHLDPIIAQALEQMAYRHLVHPTP